MTQAENEPDSGDRHDTTDQKPEPQVGPDKPGDEPDTDHSERDRLPGRQQ